MGGPYKVVSCGTCVKHLVLRRNGELDDRTLCGRQWRSIPAHLTPVLWYDAKRDCQSCRKQQEDRA